MRKINAAQLNLIDALVAEYDIGGLNAGILEKDIHVTDALSALMRIEDPKIRLIFCGGTSLSKAFNLIERMSEDIDIKIDLEALSDLSITARRTYLSDYKDKIKKALTDAGFVETTEMTEAHNANHLFSMEWRYASEYQNEASLRPHLKVEVKTCKITRPTARKEIGYLADKLANRRTTVTVATCQAIEETLAEKVISFLRRYDRATHLGEKWDSALIRHLYDVYCITLKSEEMIECSKACFPTLISNDAEEYGNQHASFKADPLGTLLKSLQNTAEDPALAENYQEKVLPLVLGKVKPSFAEVHTKFTELAQALLTNSL